MSLPITSIVRNANQTWTFAWVTTTAAYYRVVLYGIQLAQVTTATYIYSIGGYGAYPPPLEIAEEGAKTLSELYPPTLTIQWYDEACGYFDIQSSPDGITYDTELHIVEGALWVYTYQTPIQTDGTVVYLGVAAVDVLGNESSSELYTSLIVTPPTSPDGQIVISYVQSGHQIQIASA